MPIGAIFGQCHQDLILVPRINDGSFPCRSQPKDVAVRLQRSHHQHSEYLAYPPNLEVEWLIRTYKPFTLMFTNRSIIRSRRFVDEKSAESPKILSSAVKIQNAPILLLAMA
jgi:hypothetical protein